MEKLPVHTEVINLRRLLFPRNVSDSVNVDFTLAKRDEFPYMYFLINHSSRGILTIRKEIDRDELCRLRRCRCDTWCDLELELFINSAHFNIELITIRILDRNDHKPVFANQNSPLNLTIVENAQVGAMIKLEAATDPDQGTNGIVGKKFQRSRTAGIEGVVSRRRRLFPRIVELVAVLAAIRSGTRRSLLGRRTSARSRNDIILSVQDHRSRW